MILPNDNLKDYLKESEMYIWRLSYITVLFILICQIRERGTENHKHFKIPPRLFLFLGLKLIIIFFSSEKKRSRSLMGKVRTGCFVISNF